MANVFRCVKSKNYTVINNEYLRDKNLRLESIGLMTIILSLSSDYRITMESLLKLTKENYRTIKLILQELKSNGYVEIKPGTQNYTKLKLKGKGIKGVNSNTAGDMYVVVNVIMPTKLNRKQKDLLKELSETDLETESEFKEFKKSLKN